MSKRQLLIDAAIELFREHGYRDVGLNQVLECVGTSKTTFYKYFDSFEMLGVAAIREEGRDWLESISHPVVLCGTETDGPPLEPLIAWLQNWLDSTTFRTTPFLRAIAEFPDHRDPRHLAGVEMLNEVFACIKRSAELAGFADPHDFAEQFQTILTGSYFLSGCGAQPPRGSSLRELAQILISSWSRDRNVRQQPKSPATNKRRKRRDNQ